MRNVIILIIITFLFSTSARAEDSIRIGTTFSKQQCIYLGLEWKETYLNILDFNWDIMRLGAYWSEIESEENQYEFEELDWQIKKAKEKGIPVVLTIGMKAPRWPEYFIPEWVSEKTDLKYSGDISNDPVLKEGTLRFIKKVIDRYSEEKAIAYIQIENEALNKFGGKNWQISKKFLSEEVKLITSADSLERPVILTSATYPNKFLRFLANIFTKGNWINDNLELCDILGINVYPTIGQKTFGIKHYIKTHPLHRKNRFTQILKTAKKKGVDVWVMELQAEPWEPAELVHTKKRNPPSISPEAVETYFDELKEDGFRTILLWGAEYWYYQKKENNNLQWWEMAEKIIKDSKSFKLKE